MCPLACLQSSVRADVVQVRRGDGDGVPAGLPAQESWRLGLVDGGRERGRADHRADGLGLQGDVRAGTGGRRRNRLPSKGAAAAAAAAASNEQKSNSDVFPAVFMLTTEGRLHAYQLMTSHPEKSRPDPEPGDEAGRTDRHAGSGRAAMAVQRGGGSAAKRASRAAASTRRERGEHAGIGGRGQR